MTKEQSLQILISVCEKASKACLFSLSESSLVLQSLENFGVTPPKVDDIKQDEVEEQKSETKEVKD